MMNAGVPGGVVEVRAKILPSVGPAAATVVVCAFATAWTWGLLEWLMGPAPSGDGRWAFSFFLVCATIGFGAAIRSAPRSLVCDVGTPRVTVRYRSGRVATLTPESVLQVTAIKIREGDGVVARFRDYPRLRWLRFDRATWEEGVGDVCSAVTAMDPANAVEWYHMRRSLRDKAAIVLIGTPVLSAPLAILLLRNDPPLTVLLGGALACCALHLVAARAVLSSTEQLFVDRRFRSLELVSMRWMLRRIDADAVVSVEREAKGVRVRYRDGGRERVEWFGKRAWGEEAVARIAGLLGPGTTTN